MFKKIAIASVIILALTGCSSNNTEEVPTPVITVTEQAPDPIYPPAEDSYVDAETEYLSALHSMNDPYIESTTDADLVEIGNTICSALDEGNSIMDLITYLATNGTFDNTEQAEAAGMIIAASATTLCSEYTSDVQDFITQNS